MKRTLVVSAILLAVVAVSAGECDAPAAPQAKNTQQVAAARAANSIIFTENAEIDNIKRRIELTSSPGLLGFIILMNDAGQPIIYEGVRGKVTSSGKRLTPTFSTTPLDTGEWNGEAIVDAPSDEGTFGASSPYIFYWNTEGQYRQWSGAYLYSDKPMRLNVEPLVISIAP